MSVRRSRLSRIEEQRLKKRIGTSIIVSVGLLAFLAFFGLRLVVGLSVLLERLRFGTPQDNTQAALILPPLLDPLSEATNSAWLDVSGSGQPGAVAVLFLNDGEIDREPIDEAGRFTFTSIQGIPGVNSLSAQIEDGQGNRSDFSNTVVVRIITRSPALEIERPSSGDILKGDDNEVEVAGKTEEGMTVTVNGRFIMTRAGGEFRTTVPLTEGENMINIAAFDKAGNTTEAQRTVYYEP